MPMEQIRTCHLIGKILESDDRYNGPVRGRCGVRGGGRLFGGRCFYGVGLGMGRWGFGGGILGEGVGGGRGVDKVGGGSMGPGSSGGWER